VLSLCAVNEVMPGRRSVFKISALLCKLCRATVVVQQQNCLLICCLEGEVLQIECPRPSDHDANVAKTFHMSTLATRTYKFLSVKSKILVGRLLSSTS